MLYILYYYYNIIFGIFITIFGGPAQPGPPKLKDITCTRDQAAGVNSDERDAIVN